jgi:hypothetical protein
MRRGDGARGLLQTRFAAIPQRFHIGVTILPYSFASFGVGLLGDRILKVIANRGDS